MKAPRVNPPEPFAKEAIQFVQSRVLQHDIEFEVSSQDKGGNFIGNLWTTNKENIAALLLEEGLAFTQQGALKENPHSTELLIAEDAARKAKKVLISISISIYLYLPFSLRFALSIYQLTFCSLFVVCREYGMITTRLPNKRRRRRDNPNTKLPEHPNKNSSTSL